MISNYNIKTYFIQILCVFILAVDVIEHFFLFSSLSDLLRFLLVILLFYLQFIKKSFFLILIALIICTLQSLNATSINEVLVNYSFLFKIFLFFFSFTLLINHKYNLSRNRVIFISIFFVLNIILTWFGFGNTNYGFYNELIPYGSKGIYPSGNEFGISFFIIFTTYAIYNTSQLLIIFSSIVTGFLIFTKFSLFTSFYILITTLFKFNFLKSLKFFFCLPFILVPLYHFIIPLFVQKFTYDYSISKSLISFLLSGRDIRIIESFKNFYDSDLITILFGEGFYNVKYGKNLILFTENDFFDILFIYGLVGLLLLIITTIYIFIISLKITPKSFFILFPLVLLAITGGHVIYNTIAPPLIIFAIYKKSL